MAADARAFMRDQFSMEWDERPEIAIENLAKSMVDEWTISAGLDILTKLCANQEMLAKTRFYKRDILKVIGCLCEPVGQTPETVRKALLAFIEIGGQDSLVSASDKICKLYRSYGHIGNQQAQDDLLPYAKDVFSALSQLSSQSVVHDDNALYQARAIALAINHPDLIHFAIGKYAERKLYGELVGLVSHSKQTEFANFAFNKMAQSETFHDGEFSVLRKLSQLDCGKGLEDRLVDFLLREQNNDEALDQLEAMGAKGIWALSEVINEKAVEKLEAMSGRWPAESARALLIQRKTRLAHGENDVSLVDAALRISLGNLLNVSLLKEKMGEDAIGIRQIFKSAVEVQLVDVSVLKLVGEIGAIVKAEKSVAKRFVAANQLVEKAQQELFEPQVA